MDLVDDRSNNAPLGSTTPVTIPSDNYTHLPKRMMANIAKDNINKTKELGQEKSMDKEL